MIRPQKKACFFVIFCKINEEREGADFRFLISGFQNWLSAVSYQLAGGKAEG